MAFNMKKCVISKDEYYLILGRRGCHATGYELMTAVVDGAEKFYYWSYGIQPNEALLHRISSKNPMKAAKRFLQLFEKGGCGHGSPRLRS